MAAINPTRYVTGLDAAGRSFFEFEGPPAGVTYTAPSSMVVPWETFQFPTDVQAPEDTGRDGIPPLHNTTGTTCRTGTFAPGYSSEMHRTATIDYGVVIEGEVVLELDDGSERTLKKGDVAVQRGTMHAWHNRTDQPTYMFWVMVAAAVPQVDGKPLDITHPGGTVKK